MTNATQRGDESVVVSVDVGTSGVRAMAFTQDYHVLAGAARELTTTVGAGGRSTQSWPEVAAAAQSVIAELALSPGLRICAVCLSGTASSLAVSSARSAGSVREIGEILLWSDTRASVAKEREVEAMASERYEQTLCPSHASYWPAKLHWIANDCSMMVGDLQFAGAKDYLFELLTGCWWVDPMTAAATGVFDSKGWRWDEEFLSMLGISTRQLPVVRAGTDRAPILPGMAKELGLAPDTTIVVGGMDGPLAQLGASGFRTGAHTTTVGTSIAYRAGSDKRTIDPSHRVWCYPVTPSFWVIGGAGSNGGNVVAWLAETLGHRDDLGRLVAEALTLPPDPDLVFLPYLNGERAPLWREDLRGALVGLSAHHGAAHIARAALDGIGAAVIELADAVTAVVGNASEVRLTGGFLQDEAWAQLVTDSIGHETCVPEPEAATSTGAAVLAWMSLGEAAPQPPRPAVATRPRAPERLSHEILYNKAFALQRARRALFGSHGHLPYP